MYTVLLHVLAPVLICIGIGFSWARRGVAYDTGFVSRLVMNVGAPCLIISSITQVEISTTAMLQVSGAALGVVSGSAILAAIVVRFTGGEWRTLVPPVIFSNSGNMGLPLCLFAFGQEGLVLAVAYFLPLTVLHMSVGLFIVSNAEGGTFSRILHTVRQPILISAVLACVMLMFNLSLPLWVKNTVDLLGGMTIPLMLITLGVSLATLHSSNWLQSLLYSVLRIGGGLALGIFFAHWFELEGAARNVVILQAMLPAAVFNYLLAVGNNRQPELVAGIVVTSTAMVFLFLPFVLPFLVNS